MNETAAKIEAVGVLIKRIKTEEEKKIAFNKSKEIAIEKAGKDGYYWHCIEWNDSMPSNEKIKDACKMARALLLEISKESKTIGV